MKTIRNSIRIAVVGLSFFLVAACNSNAKKESEETSEELVETEEKSTKAKIYQGEYVYTPDAAVLTGRNFVYGVEINELAKELGARTDSVKTSVHDVVPVLVRGVISPKPAGSEGWDERITITEIIDVSKTPVPVDIQLNKQ